MTIQIRRDSATNWASENPVLAAGQPGLEEDTGKIKYGNGSTPWNSLDYFRNKTKKHFGVTVEAPTTSDNIRFGFVDDASLITKTVVTVRGSSTPSITVDIRHGVDRRAVGAALLTAPLASNEAANNAESTGHITSSFDNPNLAPNSYIWLEIVGISGTVDAVEIVLFYDEE